MSVKAQYDQRRMDPPDAVALVGDGDTVVLPIGAGEAPALLHALSDRRRDLRGVTVFQLLPLVKADYFDPDTTEHVRHSTAFLGGTSRKGAAQGWVDYCPAHFSEIPELIRRGLLPCDVVFARASAMDEHGYFSLGLSADYTMAAIERARAVVLEVNPGVPFCFGDCHVHISQVTALVESSEAIVELPHPALGPVELGIGRFVAELIPDGATLQIGIGAIPDAVVQQLGDKNDLGVHTEMFGDGILSLLEAGVITNSRKNLHHGKMLATFALGSRHLYEYMHRNPALEMHPVDVTNDPFLAGPERQPALDQRHVGGGPDRAVRLGDPGPSAVLRKWWSGRLRPGGEPLEGRQGDHRGALDGPRRHRVADRRDAGTRDPRDDGQERRGLRGHGVRGGAAARPVGPGAREGADRHRPPRLPRPAGRRRRPPARGLIPSGDRARQSGRPVRTMTFS